VNWKYEAQFRENWRAVLNTVMEIVSVKHGQMFD
jgi:hypothetical protein